MTKFKAYCTKINVLTNAYNTSTPLNDLLSIYGEAYVITKELQTDYIQGRLSDGQFEVLSKSFNAIFSSIRLTIIDFVLDKYNKE